MIYKRFYIGVIIQLLLFALVVFLMMWSLVTAHHVITGVNLAVIALVQLIYLVYYISAGNRDLARFFEAFHFHDTSLSFSRKRGQKVFQPLYQNFDRILDEYRDLRKTQEKDRLFFLSILNHFQTGVLVTDASENVLFTNQAIRTLNEGREIRQLAFFGKLKPNLPELLRNMRADQRELVKVIDSGEMVIFSVRCSEFLLEEKLLRIFSFQDIHYEIEQREVEAWQKLIRILTHEISNSVGPVTLTSAGIINLFEKNGHPRNPWELNESDIGNALLGLRAIRKRSKGLARFVENYRSIAHIPQPVFSKIKVSDLFRDIGSLLKDETSAKGIVIEQVTVPPSLQLMADERLIYQVLMNLCKNAIQALQGIPQPVIKLGAWTENKSVYISVKDNGVGIESENMENIFIPFFTTKPEGSGIGLSLSRQIMRLHSGNIFVYSVPGIETEFRLKF